jgi:hypothetical protein
MLRPCKPRVFGALLLALAAARPAQAGAPFQTDDPGVVALGHSEIIAFYQQTLSAVGRSGVLPALEFHYGPARSLELDVAVGLAFAIPPGEDVRRGYGDTMLGVKYAFLDETDTRPAVGFVPKLALATGNADRGLGNGGYALFLPIWLQKKWGNLQAYGGGGYWLNHGANNRNYSFVGAQAQYTFSEHWVVGAEVFHTTPQTLDQRASTGFNAGGFYVIDAHAQWLVSLGKGVQNAAQTNRVSSYLGYQLNY